MKACRCISIFISLILFLILLDEVAAKLPQAKSARPEQFVDLGLLQELEKEGFFSEMGKRYS